MHAWANGSFTHWVCCALSCGGGGVCRLAGSVSVNTEIHQIGYFCTYAPRCSRLNISLKKNTTTLKFDLDLPVAVFEAMVFAKKIFSNRKYFFLEFTNL